MPDGNFQSSQSFRAAFKAGHRYFRVCLKCCQHRKNDRDQRDEDPDDQNRIAYAFTRFSFFFFPISAKVILITSPKSHIDKRDCKDYHHNAPLPARRHTHLIILKSIPVYLMCNGCGGVHRPSVCHDQHLPKHLEGVDTCHNKHKKSGWLQHGDCHMNEFFPGCSPSMLAASYR